MTSNIRIEKVCQYCGTKFIAKTTVTRYCSHSCNKKPINSNKEIQK